MLYHRAFGRDLETLSVAVIDNRKPMLAVMRAMLAAIGTGRIDIYESPTEALDAMPKSLPDLVIAAAAMQPLSGPALVRAMRRECAGPLAFVPAMIMSAHAKPSLIEDALKAGAHQVLVLPTAASTLYRRLDWLLHDDRPFELHGQHYVVAGLDERLSVSFQKPMPEPAASRAAKSTPEDEPPQPLPKKKRAARN